MSQGADVFAETMWKTKILNVYFNSRLVKKNSSYFPKKFYHHINTKY